MQKILRSNNRGEVENGGELGGRSKERRRESVGSVGADRGYLESNKKAQREALVTVRAYIRTAKKS